MQDSLQTQNRQYKVRRDEECLRAPRTEHKNIERRLKDEQEYKSRAIYENYKQLMDDLVANQNVSPISL